MGPRDTRAVQRDRLAGSVMLLVAGLGLLVAIVSVIVGWRLVSDLDRGLGGSLELTADVLVSVDESFAVAEEALGILAVGVSDAEGAVRSLARSLDEGSVALTTATQLTGGEVADALESVERSLPAVQNAAEAIDDTLATLEALPLGLDYRPEQPLGDTIAAMREHLGALPDQLREQARQVATVRDELTAATQGTVATADTLTAFHDRLVAVETLIDDYASTTGDARVLIDVQRDTLRSGTARAHTIVILLGGMFALMQIVPLYYGMSLRGSIPGLDRRPT